MSCACVEGGEEADERVGCLVHMSRVERRPMREKKAKLRMQKKHSIVELLLRS